MAGQLSEEEARRLTEIAERLRMTREVRLCREEPDDEDWPDRVYLLFRLPNRRIVGSLNIDFEPEGQLFHHARADEAFLLRLVKRLLDEG